MMNKRYFAIGWALGLVTIAWVALGFIGTSWLALAVTGVIGATFGLGVLELRQFRAQTEALGQSVEHLTEAPVRLDDWLEQVPAPLRNAVRGRVEGTRGGLPGPALTPYLVGLLVMLGMLGTFLGMVVTFQGTVFALEGSTDLQAMRSALAAPIRGLGLSFGTSVAGVAASALLGLMSALCRRERVDVARRLDSRIAAVLRPFSRATQRQATLDAMQAQSSALPVVAERLEALMERIEQRSQQLDTQLLERQAQFQREVAAAHAALGERVGLAAQESLSAGLERVLSAFHLRFGESSAALLGEVQSSLAEGQARQAGAERERLAAFGQAVQAATAVVAQMREEAVRSAEHDAVTRQAQDEQHQRVLRERSEMLGGLNALFESARQAAETQRQAIDGLTTSSADVLAKTGTGFTEILNQASARFIERLDQTDQRFTDALSQSSGRFNDALVQSSERLGALAQAQAEHATQQATQAGATAVELAATGEAFGQAVQEFQATTAQLVTGLQRIEAGIASAQVRSDEQLAYYVAQAREVIDLSIASQHGLVESLRQLQAAEEARA